MINIIQFIRHKILNYKVKREGGQAFSVSLRKFYLERYGIKIGYGSYGGCFHRSHIPRGTEFGNYCSIAQGVQIFRANHPLEYFTLHPLFYNPVMGYVKKDRLDRPKLYIGHDVWIGANVIILSGCCKVGNGAIIGAGSVITKDVPPYAIVAGNPAKRIRMRFSPDVIEKLEATEWWNQDKNELIKHKGELEKIVNGA